jgi:hypothetical protein
MDLHVLTASRIDWFLLTCCLALPKEEHFRGAFQAADRLWSDTVLHLPYAEGQGTYKIGYPHRTKSVVSAESNAPFLPGTLW